MPQTFHIYLHTLFMYFLTIRQAGNVADFTAAATTTISVIKKTENRGK